VNNIFKFYMVQLRGFAHFLESRLSRFIDLWLRVIWFHGFMHSIDCLGLSIFRPTLFSHGFMPSRLFTFVGFWIHILLRVFYFMVS
jgi:hypothetical protein